MTDEQIIKALECHANAEDAIWCDECAYKGYALRYLDLINRQKAEIENYSIAEKDLRYRNKEFEIANKRQAEYIKGLESELQTSREIRADAIKEFAERLKWYLSLTIGKKISIVTSEEIDNLVKEMTEEKENA